MSLKKKRHCKSQNEKAPTNNTEPGTAQVGARLKVQKSILNMQKDTFLKISSALQCQKTPKGYAEDSKTTFSPTGDFQEKRKIEGKNFEQLFDESLR